MGWVAFLIAAAAAACVLIGNGVIDRDFLDDKLVWAALLPAVYLMGLALLKD